MSAATLTGTAVLESNPAVFSEIKRACTLCPAVPHAGYVPRQALTESPGSTGISLLVLSLENGMCASGTGGWGEWEGGRGQKGTGDKDQG